MQFAESVAAQPECVVRMLLLWVSGAFTNQLARRSGITFDTHGHHGEFGVRICLP